MFGFNLDAILQSLKGGQGGNPFQAQAPQPQYGGVRGAMEPFIQHFGKDAPSWRAASGMPSIAPQQGGQYNQQAQTLGNPFAGMNFNLGGGAMPGLDDQSRYGSGFRGAFNKFTQDPRAQSFGQGFQGAGQLFGAMQRPQGIQLDPALLQQQQAQMAGLRGAAARPQGLLG